MTFSQFLWAVGACALPPDYRPVVEGVELETIGQVIEVVVSCPSSWRSTQVPAGSSSSKSESHLNGGIELALTRRARHRGVDHMVTVLSRLIMAVSYRWRRFALSFYREHRSPAEYRARTIAPVRVRAGEGTDGRIGVLRAARFAAPLGRVTPAPRKPLPVGSPRRSPRRMAPPRQRPRRHLPTRRHPGGYRWPGLVRSFVRMKRPSLTTSCWRLTRVP